MGSLLSRLTDSRLKPSIPTHTIFRSAVIMMLARMGSLHALEQDKGNRFWRRWLGRALPSADTIGRVFCQVVLVSIRSLLHHLYSRLKRNKALKKTHGFQVLILDGHEHTSSYLRCCSGCLRRTIHTREGDRIQYYHRNVLAMLSGRDFPVLLDVEEQKRKENEVSCALRLCERILKDYPRAFSVVVADGLYLEAPFFKLFLRHGKHIIAVLKDERRDLMEDARGLFQQEKPLIQIEGNLKRQIWDMEGFTSWQSLKREIRVVRCVETRTIRRQRTGEIEEETSEWIWATTLSQKEASTEAIIHLGHDRWLIENKVINEMVTYWHANHVYHHHPTAIVAFWLTLMLVLNLFRAFLYLNIKPEWRSKHTQIYFAMLIS
ncbi:transposase, partial [Candidatus Hakubella thermalkaliphila]